MRRVKNTTKKIRKKTTNWFKNLDQFPNIYSTRMSYNGQESKQTLTGAFCTVLLILLLLVITIIYMIPVLNNENPHLSEQLKGIDNDFELKFGESYVNYFGIMNSTGGVLYDKTKIYMYVQKITKF